MTPNWETVIGLEVHVQLRTRTKLFCACAAEFGDLPNTNVCPVCLGLPGALPVTNREAVRLGVRASIALGCTVHPRSEFARKNYFYPDLPKGYQISQFEKPLSTDGSVTIETRDGESVVVGITRLHLEEDAGKSIHDRFPEKTALDFNRAGVPLAEIVTEPDLRTPAQARAWLDELKRILQYADASDCSMERGHLRVDANVSVRTSPDEPLGTKQEIKNLNSFTAVERALDDLSRLQVEQLTRGDVVEQATFSYATGALRMMRSKEESHDYRYFPEPDLPVLEVDGSMIAAERETSPEFPAQRRERLRQQYGVTSEEARVITDAREVADYYEDVITQGADPKLAAHWIMGPVLRMAKNDEGHLRVDAPRLAELIGLVAGGTLSNQAGKKVFNALAETHRNPLDVARQMGVLQVDDDEKLGQWVDGVIERFPQEFARLRGGEAKLLGFFIGEVMKESGGRADPRLLQQLIRSRLN